MNRHRASQCAAGFTLVEMLLVILIIGLLAAMLLPTLNQGKARAQRIQCVANLRQVGLAFHGFAHDHGGQFPMQVPINAGGSQELAENGYHINGDFYFSYRHFLPLSNELATAQLLVCPADPRWPAVKFAALQNSNLSYFVNVKAEYGKPDSPLAGDRNLIQKWHAPATLVAVRSGNEYLWSDELHRARGNILFSDGHVDELNKVPLLTADLVLPTPLPPNLATTASTALGAEATVRLSGASASVSRPAARVPDVTPPIASRVESEGTLVASAANPANTSDENRFNATAASSARVADEAQNPLRVLPAPTQSWQFSLSSWLWLLLLLLLVAMLAYGEWRRRRKRTLESFKGR